MRLGVRQVVAGAFAVAVIAGLWMLSLPPTASVNGELVRRVRNGTTTTSTIVVCGLSGGCASTNPFPIQTVTQPNPTTPTTPVTIPPTIRRGARGGLVTELQNLLVQHGFNPGPIDGKFGRFTRAAVIAFQRAHGLPADGVVGPATWAALLAS